MSNWTGSFLTGYFSFGFYLIYYLKGCLSQWNCNGIWAVMGNNNILSTWTLFKAKFSALFECCCELSDYSAHSCTWRKVQGEVRPFLPLLYRKWNKEQRLKFHSHVLSLVRSHFIWIAYYAYATCVLKYEQIDSPFLGIGKSKVNLTDI